MALGDDLVASLVDMFMPEKAAGLSGLSVQLELTGEGGGLFHATIAEHAIDTGQGAADVAAATIRVSVDDFREILDGRLNLMSAFMNGRVGIEGSIDAARAFLSTIGLIDANIPPGR